MSFSQQLVAYIAAFLPTAPYFKSNDGRISTVCDDQYSSTLAMLETADEAFKVYMTHKTQGWFRLWACPRPYDAAASPGPCATPNGAGSGAQAESAKPARSPAGPAQAALAASDDEGASDLITGA